MEKGTVIRRAHGIEVKGWEIHKWACAIPKQSTNFIGSGARSITVTVAQYVNFSIPSFFHPLLLYLLKMVAVLSFQLVSKKGSNWAMHTSYTIVFRRIQ